ncbi:hypothetical protein Nepgr_013015 [Nepenthes gracilis]|uniref:RecF/RecN/SMC N-terminal domain-containing protein n=1 Tax=Nepenthes gracilis TaxID=150966 RepID=A0AAD3XNQ6_NEPGR|nr:hypothetical protein Nepgr_013015 [Nepenthes gracilis]
MTDFRVPPQPTGASHGSSIKAGTISKIRLENFMCHSNLQIEFGDYVNFITGQNGSGKSAILTALCIAFGSRARSTQRATTLKDFIKTGCHYAIVVVEMKNQGDDAFKPEVYGDAIIIERKVSEFSSSISLKDHQGRKVAGGKEELHELVEHFNIDVENPCVIMSQDKSREFLHSGSSKDKFKFFFKATLLQHVDELLQNINTLLRYANGLVDDLEKSIEPIVKELSELQGKIKSMEHIEEISERVNELRKKLAWSWVYDVDKQLREQSATIQKLKAKVPTWHARICKYDKIIEDLRDCFLKKKTDSDSLVERSLELKRMKDEFQRSLSMATKERLQLEEEHNRRMRTIEMMAKNLKKLQEQVCDIQDQHLKNTQAEECEMEKKLKGLKDQLDVANSFLTRLNEEENSLSEIISVRLDEIKEIVDEIEGNERKLNDISSYIRELHQHQTNKVTAFGGGRVLELLRVIERHHHRFRRPPIGPIGAHVNLINGDVWSVAVENAIGKFLNYFIVSDHEDSRLLKECAREARYDDLRFFIYDFAVPRLIIPDHKRPRTAHPSVLSVLHSDNHTVMNVLVDKGAAERQVLVKDYDEGKIVAFGQDIPNLKEVYTQEGYNMFSRGSVQTVLPPNKRARTGRLCSSYDNQIQVLQRDMSHKEEHIRKTRQRKRDMEIEVNNTKEKLQIIKRRRLIAEKEMMSKNLVLQDLKNSLAAEASSFSAPSLDELSEEISRIENDMQEKEMSLEKFREGMNAAEAKVKNLKASFEKLCESAKGVSDGMGDATNELSGIEEQLRSAESEKAQFEKGLSEKLLPTIKHAEEQYSDLEKQRKEYYEKASYVCPESEVEAFGGCMDDTPEQLSAQLNRLKQRLAHESQNSSDSIEDLRIMYEKKKSKILRKQQTIEDFRQKLNACKEALDLRQKKFLRNASLLKRQLTLKFIGHLGKKGISGNIKVSYEEKTLLIEIKMPQDASSTAVRDTRGLSGGERSFSTLCFSLALHEMIEAPFRAMDEFDVFMDAVSRKISLDTLVDFAVSQGSQWIFITPHDISMVKQGDRVKKQQMAAPRS